MAKIEAEKKAHQEAKWGKKASNCLDPATNKFDIKELQAGIPEGVEPARKEAYLSDEQFEATFGCNLEAFDKLKDWKKKDIKKAKGLF